ncbi:MAG: CxxC-x17-CxxC domain-containing protein [Patescibacteria group bacterium]
MGNAYRVKNYDSKRGGRGRGFGGGRDNRRSQMYEAVCDACGKDCEVPFRPSGEKPVYCSPCFDKQGGRERHQGKRQSFSDKRNDKRPDRQVRTDNNFKQEIETLNNKLDKIVQLLTPISAAAELLKNDSPKSGAEGNEAVKNKPSKKKSVGKKTKKAKRVAD